jgi:hypothetical protein
MPKGACRSSPRNTGSRYRNYRTILSRGGTDAGRPLADTRLRVPGYAAGLMRGTRIRRPLLCFSLCVILAGALSAGARAQDVPGWRLRETPHFLIYVVEGTPGARDVEQVAAGLELLHREVLAPLRLPPTKLVYPLYPSLERFTRDWWYFATLDYGDIVHAWGTIYTGDSREVTPYTITRAAVGGAFPRAIPLLRWGVGDALGDRAAGVDAHRPVEAILNSGGEVPMLRSILAPADFGSALPASYPAAVSFLAFLIERYGPAQTSRFVDVVSYQYYDFDTLFVRHFAESVDTVEAAWRERIRQAEAPPVDLNAYYAANRFVYRVTLAGNPGRRMLLPDGPVVVAEAFRAVEQLRRLDLAGVSARMDAAQRATAAAERSERRTDLTLRGIIYVVVGTPLLLAVGWLLWPSVRGWLAGRREAVGRH